MDSIRKASLFPRFEFRNEYFLFLLPLFFVFHGYNEYFGKVGAGEALLLFLQYVLALAAVALAFFFVFRSFRKAALLAFALACFYFFFGAGHDWLKAYLAGTVLVKYSFILPAVLLIFITFFFYLKRTQHTFHRLVKYLNILFFCLIGVETGTVFFKELPHQEIIRRASVDNPVARSLKPCDTCLKEDIHLIVLDEYAGVAQLKDVFHFDNTPFLDSLRARGFRVINGSTSNYNFTPISMASMFSLDYLPGVRKWPEYELVDVGSSIINKNIFIDYLVNHGYQINNISIFDLNKKPAYKKKFSYGLRLIYRHTFLDRLERDLGYHLLTTLKWQNEIEKAVRDMEAEAAKNISTIELTSKIVTEKKVDSHQFYYTHLMMPHDPFVLDRNGNSVGYSYYMDSDQVRGYKRGYLEHLQFSNKKILSFVDTLMKTSSRPPVIILMSDHGFRHLTVEEKYQYMTLNAVFFPDGQYDGFYDGMSNVNQLRVLLNNRFNQQLHLLKDSSYSLWPTSR